MAEWGQNKTNYMQSAKDSLRLQRHPQAKSEGMERDTLQKWKPKKAGVAILVSD